MSKRKTVAYHGEYRFGESGVVVFAATRNEAKKLAHYRLSEFEQGDYIDVRVRRVPQFDRFVEQGYIPVSEVLADEWWCSCDRCGDYPLYERDAGLVIDGPPEHAEWSGGKVYCKKCAPRIQREDEAS